MSISDNSVIIVLGAPNSPEGLLSPVAISRLETCLAIYRREPAAIILTGGYGPHFNTTNKPHTWYARQYLDGKGIPNHHFVGTVFSSNTVEDAVLSRPLIMPLRPSCVTIITSDYHLQRAGLIFCDVYQDAVPLRFVPAPSYALGREELRALLQHEERAIQDLMTKGIRYVKV